MHIFHRQYVEKQQCNKVEKQKLSFWIKKKIKWKSGEKSPVGLGGFCLFVLFFFKQKNVWFSTSAEP